MITSWTVPPIRKLIVFKANITEFSIERPVLFSLTNHGHNTKLSNTPLISQELGVDVFFFGEERARIRASVVRESMGVMRARSSVVDGTSREEESSK